WANVLHPWAALRRWHHRPQPDGPTCLVLDVRLPGQSGLDLQRELAAANRELPIIFITGHGDIPMSVQAMKGGAIGFRRSPSVIRTSSTPFSSASLAIVPQAGPWRN